MVEISTSILSVNPETFTKIIYATELAKTDYFHIDVMDGKFVEQNTIKKMSEYTQTIKQISNIPIEIHLMVEDVKKYVDEYLAIQPHIIIFQVEAIQEKNEIKKMIEYIKQNCCKVGLAIKPNTTVESIKEFLPFLHQVLVMTVEPGKGGQTLINSTILKINELFEIRKEQNLDFNIGADGRN